MPELLIQRVDKTAFFAKYPLYINRKEHSRIGFGETLRFDLEPGRYQIHVGSRYGLDAEIWVNLSDHRKALQIDSEYLLKKDRTWPKWYKLKWKALGPAHLAKEEQVTDLKRLYQNGLIKVWGFSFIWLLAAAWLYFMGQQQENEILTFLSFLMLPMVIWVQRGMKVALLKNASQD